MPVGTGFENSAMKASFSLSSLQASAAETPDKSVAMRTCNSLTKKKRREEYWRRSWGSAAGSSVSDQKDDFWSALQANYDYIMDNQLIDHCQEARGELTLDARLWSLKEFYMQFSELYSWLNSIQETLCKNQPASPEESLLKNRYINEVIKKNSLLKIFNEQASQLVQSHPEMEEEVTWRVMRLNSKWETVESTLGLSDCRNCNLHTCKDIEHEIKRLRTWMKNTEALLQPLVFRVKWSSTEIENKTLEHKLLHRDIESHGKLVSSVVKLCKGQNDGTEGANIRRVVRGLERRWHLLFLRSLEWQCHIDSLSKNINNKNFSTQTSESSDSDIGHEPLNKYPRLNGSFQLNNNCNLSAYEEKPDFNDYDYANNNNYSETMMKSKDEIDVGKTINKMNEIKVTTPERVKSPEDSSAFTKSNRKAPNLGTYYFKHEDTTDSEIHTANKSKASQNANDDSSEDEWIYSSNNDKKDPEKKCEVTTLQQNTFSSASKTSCRDIRRLVQEAEELVRESPVKRIKSSTGAPLNKMSRVKQWLNMDRPNDSCDASCEEEEKDSQSSEDLNESVATCRAQQEMYSSSAGGIDTDKAESTPKVQMRQKRIDLKRNRPWSMSCISQLPCSSSRETKKENFSISESALHQLCLSPKYSKSLTTSANSISLYQNNSTSSTVEEGGNTFVEHNSTPMRRRRLKFRKKSSNSFRRGSNDPESSRERIGNLIKSGSFSGSSCSKIVTVERNTSSDPSTTYHGPQKSLSTLSNTSDAESDEDEHTKGMPMFKIGETTTYLSQDDRDNSPGKSSINNTEEHSSLSEQAWDSYQEKYLSEAYSEAQDSDAARRLLEFGEDYRNFLDSQSDWSAQSTNPEFSPPFKRKILPSFNVVESESDSEDVRNLLKASRDELLQIARIFNQHFSGELSDNMSRSDSNIIATCDRHIYCLHLIEKSPEEYSLSKLDREKTSDLLLRWKRLKEKSNKMQEYRSMQRDIVLLKNEFTEFTIPAPFESIVNSMDDIRKSIAFYSTRLVEMEERKAKLLTLNVAVHRFVTENKTYNSTSLKNGISELYCMWYDIHSSATEKLNQLKCLLQAWQTLESRLDQFHGDLQEDKETLTILDSAVRDGVLSNHIATSVREVAKVLSETNQASNLPGLLSESSFSDSGISDEGSEHEQGERERRLASIRHLMRQLENVMAPDCFAKIDISERFSAAEDELRSLQKRCRSLVVRTAAGTVSPNCGEQQPTAVVFSDPGDPEDKSGGLSWFKRVMRASLPFQLAIVTLLCVACLLEPHCCDNMNTFSMSLSPQLRYIRGPPPV